MRVRADTKTLHERLWSRIDVDLDGCWLWTGAKDAYGYGIIRVGGRRGSNWLVHRLLDALRNGPTDLHVLHHCDVPNCVRPDHLWRGTALDNMRDMDTKGRCVRIGQRRRKLNDEQVAHVLSSPETSEKLAQSLPVSASAVARLRRQGGYLPIPHPWDPRTR